MARAVDSPRLAQELGLSRELLAEISAELLTLARRADLESAMEAAIARISHMDQSEQRIAKAAIIGERFVNRLVSEMGFADVPPADRPTVAGGSRPIFAPRAVVYGVDGWTAGPPAYYEEFFDDWANAFYRVVEDNAKSQAGLKIDFVQNERLGVILADLRNPV